MKTNHKQGCRSHSHGWAFVGGAAIGIATLGGCATTSPELERYEGGEGPAWMSSM